MAAWNSGDLDTTLKYLTEDVRWETGGIFPGLEPVYTGHAGVRRFWRGFMDPWETISIVPIAISEPSPGQLVAHVRFRASGRQGIEVDLELWQIYRMRKGRVHHFVTLTDPESAFAAASADADPE
jgi:ketosteroid isomerase-like protein